MRRHKTYQPIDLSALHLMSIDERQHKVRLEDLAVPAAPEAGGLRMLVTTGKDFVKWQPLLAGRRSLPPVDVAALEVTMRVLEGEEALRREMDALLRR